MPEDRIGSMPGFHAQPRVARIVVSAAIGLTAATAIGQSTDQTWWERAGEWTTGHYALKTDLPRDEARELATHLNLMYEHYSHRLASLPQRAPEVLNVMIFARQADYLSTMRGQFGINAEGTGGMFFVNPKGKGLAFFTGELSRQRIAHVMQHEGFHQFAFSRFGSDLPLWVNEGLAELFGEAVLLGRDFVIGQRPARPLETVKSALASGDHVRFHDMLTMSHDQWGANLRAGSAALQYHQSWSMVHFLVYADPDGDGEADYVDAFERYLRLLNEGVRSDDAFARVFGADFDAFEKRWARYIEQAQPDAFVEAIRRVEFLAEGALELSRRGVKVGSLDELKAALRNLDFAYRIEGHGTSTEISAKDDAMFELDGVTLVVEPADVRRLNRRQTLLEQKHPAPPGIRTEGLEPRNLGVRWSRIKNEGKDTGEFRYQIVAQK
jgi:hypothetical protein